MDKCQRCGAERVASITAKSSDCCSTSMGEYEKSGYAPSDMGIGGGDYIDIAWCLECGQIQGEWPKPKCTAEEFNPNACTECGWEGFDEVGECESCGEHKYMWCPKCDREVWVYKLEHRPNLVHGHQCQCVFSLEELKQCNL